MDEGFCKAEKRPAAAQERVERRGGPAPGSLPAGIDDVVSDPRWLDNVKAPVLHESAEQGGRSQHSTPSPCSTAEGIAVP